MSTHHLTLEQRIIFERAEYLRARGIPIPPLFWEAEFCSMFPMPDNASTELALIKLLSDQLASVQGLFQRLEHLSDRIAAFEHQSKHRHQQIMTALETLTASVNANTAADGDLTTAVNAAIVQLGKASPTDAQLLTLASQIDANTATTKAQTDAINTALTPPPTP